MDNIEGGTQWQGRHLVRELWILLKASGVLKLQAVRLHRGSLFLVAQIMGRFKSEMGEQSA